MINVNVKNRNNKTVKIFKIYVVTSGRSTN